MMSAHFAALLASLAIFATTLLLWPISWLVKRRYPDGGDSGEVRRLRLLIRAAATLDVLYLVGWMAGSGSRDVSSASI
jgi:hypothetical protein